MYDKGFLIFSMGNFKPAHDKRFKKDYSGLYFQRISVRKSVLVKKFRSFYKLISQELNQCIKTK